MDPSAQVAVRLASPSDYRTFARLVVQLDATEPVADADTWQRDIAKDLLLAESDGAALGYAWAFAATGIGHLAQIVVDREHRRRGVGRALMHAAARRLAERRCTAWWLHVERTNHQAIALYTSLGLEIVGESWTLRLPRDRIGRLPPADASVRIRPVRPEEDHALEATYALEHGQLRSARQRGRTGFVAEEPSSAGVRGLAIFSPAGRGFPVFRADTLPVAAALLTGLEAYFLPGCDVLGLNLTDRALYDALCAAGAEGRMELFRMRGPLESALAARSSAGD